MTLSYQMTGLDEKLTQILKAVGPQARHNLYSAAANRVWDLVRSHVSAASTRHHRWATKLNAQPTGFLEKGARAITWHADAAGGRVWIPIPGITRAFHDIDITPKNAQYLTQPIYKASYGRRAGEMEKLGWKLFAHESKQGNLILFGRIDKETHPLYVLKKSIHQPQDADLLPAPAQMASVSAKAMATYIQGILKKAA